MKKLLFSAIAMIAFVGTASAQTAIDKDSADCWDKAYAYVKTQGLLNEASARKERQAYYNGCIDGKKQKEKEIKNKNTSLN